MNLAIGFMFVSIFGGADEVKKALRRPIIGPDSALRPDMRHRFCSNALNYVSASLKENILC